ncbi:MAG TPA: acyl carrier protein, partial [Solirubrobacteraceae bacterium]|nr:acyl carrier protein [Solirubrobacteraceae bacterium]
ATGAPAQWLGLLARAATGEIDERQRALLSGSGIAELDDAAVTAALDRATATAASELTHGDVDLQTYVGLTQSLAPRAFLSGLETTGQEDDKAPLRTELEALDREARTERLVDHVVGAAAEALGLPEEDVGPRRGLFDLGLDSIMALTLKTTLERDLAPLELPSTLTVELPTCLAIAKHLAGLLDAPAPAEPQRPHDDHDQTTTRSEQPADDDEPEASEPDPLAALDAAIGSAEELLNTGGAAR